MRGFHLSFHQLFLPGCSTTTLHFGCWHTALLPCLSLSLTHHTSCSPSWGLWCPSSLTSSLSAAGLQLGLLSADWEAGKGNIDLQYDPPQWLSGPLSVVLETFSSKHRIWGRHNTHAHTSDKTVVQLLF